MHFEQSILSNITFGNFLVEQEGMFSNATLSKERVQKPESRKLSPGASTDEIFPKSKWT